MIRDDNEHIYIKNSHQRNKIVKFGVPFKEKIDRYQRELHISFKTGFESNNLHYK